MSALLAFSPIMVALAALGWLRWSGRLAGLATFVTAVLLALCAAQFYLPPDRLLLALGEGVGTALMVLAVLLPGLLLYRLQEEAGGMVVLAKAITRLSPDRDIQVLFLILGLAPCVESASGFGVGTVVVVPILVALGLSGSRSAMLGLLSQVAIPWGALGVGTALCAELTSLDPGNIGARTALLTAPLPALYGLFALLLTGGKQALRRRWGAAVTGGATLSLGLWYFSGALGLELAGLLASLVTLLLLASWGRSSGGVPSTALEPQSVPGAEAKTGNDRKPIHLWQAIAPYAALSVLLLVSRLVEPVRLWLQTHGELRVSAIGLRFPMLYTPGFCVLLGAVCAALCLRVDRQGLRSACLRAWRQFVPAGAAIVFFLGTAQVMRSAGMVAVLGEGAATLGGSYCWAAPWLGALGGWLTGSNTGSNALFALLQQKAAVSAGLSPEWLVSAQNAAGSHAAMVSPTRTILAATAAGVVGTEGRLLGTIGPIALAAVAVITALLAWLV